LDTPGWAPVQTEIACEAEDLPGVCEWISKDAQYTWAGLFVEEREDGWELRYCFYGDQEGGQVHLILRRPLDNPCVPSIAGPVHAADWHEREAEDLFGIKFEGHPRLGDFILHDEIWQEDVWPMRHSFDIANVQNGRHENPDWRPHRVLEDPGAFAFTVGPVFSGAEESVHFLLESVGEDVARTIPRLFFKYRAVEKLAEGKSADDVLLLAERFAATTAFAHAYAYCQSIERLTGTQVSERAQQLRVFFAELERLRHHVGTIEAICESTALAVATAQAGMLEEELLRLSAIISGHRYLFGLCVPGGLSRDFEMAECHNVVAASGKIVDRLLELEQLLKYSGSFLDRLEEVGPISAAQGREIGLLGPVARASGVVQDLRKFQPYGGYQKLQFETPCEKEGDGYARLRVLFAECVQSLMLMKQTLDGSLERGVRVPVVPRAGAALGWCEAPRGAAFHFVRTDSRGVVQRYHIVPPSFANWLGFHLAAENFAFQDFPIILATFNLSVAENDR
jgi:Ni,Fe-hydrogenase III large subunit/Ni,Fe-hydrogenase III component G